jgi:hypothetical protein
MIGIRQVFNESLAGLSSLGRYFDEPDGGFSRLNLAEKGPDTTELVMPPVL